MSVVVDGLLNVQLVVLLRGLKENLRTTLKHIKVCSGDWVVITLWSQTASVENLEWLSQRIGMEAMPADYARTDVGYEAANVV